MPPTQYGLFPLLFLCPQKFDGKSLLLKTQHTLAVAHKEIELELNY